MCQPPTWTSAGPFLRARYRAGVSNAVVLLHHAPPAVRDLATSVGAAAVLFP
ncbi:hypothetical protein [Embleya sp. NPDC020886]|uniref:hypothetical protein n=1 Tax=Embleya sp. NPDC020886 TaxID=3363980 RepID=UPI0037B2C8DF